MKENIAIRYRRQDALDKIILSKKATIAPTFCLTIMP
jgi:hypothetical protein